MIFRTGTTLDKLNELADRNMATHLGMEFVEIGDDFLTMKMPVDSRTTQPMGILHGGASVALAETVGSIAGNYVVEEGKVCVGLDINANHLRKVVSGFVYGTAKPLHIGRQTHVWEIKIVNEKQELVCISRLTLAVISMN